MFAKRAVSEDPGLDTHGEELTGTPFQAKRGLKLWRSRGFVICPDGFHPFGGDGIALFHRHAGVGVEHLSATATAPGEKTEEMVLADGTRTRRSIESRQAMEHAATGSQHRWLR